MNFSRIKNTLIIVLVMAAVYQTGLLWLDDSTGHNFFYTVFGNLGFHAKTSNTNASIIDPTRIVVGYGNKRFSVIYPINEYKNIINKSDNAIKEIISEGEFVKTVELDWNELFSSKSIVYEFPFFVASTEYVKGYKGRGTHITSKIKSFDYIVIIPNRTDSEVLKVYFVNSDSGEAGEYQLEKSLDGENLYSQMQSFQTESEEGYSYISTKQSGFDLFKNNIFVPQWNQEGFWYIPFTKINPFEKEGVIDIKLMQELIGGFFSNNTPKWNNVDANNIYMFSDETNIVKYYPTEVLEYYNYDSIDEHTEQTLASAYNACRTFMKKDYSLKSEVFLADAIINSEGLTFYFDYTIDDLPVKIDDGIKKDASISHAIEIVVKNNTVKKYRRYVCDFEVGQGSPEVVNNDFSNALNTTIISYGGEETVTQIEGMEMGYLLDSENESVKLKWFVEMNNVIYICGTKKEFIDEDVQ